MSAIYPGQITIIHTLKSRVRMDDADYRAMLSGYGVDTSKKLTREEATDFIMKMQAMVGKKLSREAAAQAIPVPASERAKKYSDIGLRPGMASPAQLRYIEGMWADVSRQPDAAARASALRAFLKRVTGISEILWLEPRHVRMVVNALLQMKSNYRRAAENEHSMGH